MYRHIGNPSPRLCSAVATCDCENIHSYLRDLPEVDRQNECRNTIETMSDRIPLESLRTLLTIEPSLITDETAGLLLNSGNLRGTDILVELGWVPTQNVANEITSCIEGSIEDMTDEHFRAYYRPIVDWIHEKGLEITM